MKCPLCRKKYALTLITPLAEDGNSSTIHLSCPSCGISSILFVSANEWGIASVGVLTDLEGEEAREHFGKEAVSLDHALEAYIFFKERSSSFQRFL